jgi:hypothetical protein
MKFRVLESRHQFCELDKHFSVKNSGNLRVFNKKGASLRADAYVKWRRKPNEHCSKRKPKTVDLPSGNARIARFNHLVGLCRSAKATVVTEVSIFLSKSIFTVQREQM